MNGKRKLSDKFLNYAAIAFISGLATFGTFDVYNEVNYLNKKLDEAAQLSALEIIKGKNYLDNQDYDSAMLCGARARTKFYDWEDIPTEYPLIKPIIYFLNRNMIDDFKGAGMYIEFKAIDKQAKRKFSGA